jgi:endoglucanase
MDSPEGNRALTRREVLRGAAAAALAAAGLPACGRAPSPRTQKGARMELNRGPRWRGFNIHNMFASSEDYRPFEETDFQWMAEWGFNTVRIPVAYNLVADVADTSKLKEKGLAELDRGIELARQHKLHACLDMHVAPGYAYHQGQFADQGNLWKDERMQQAFCGLWRMFAQRYQEVPSAQLSFNLINEPATSLGHMTREEHNRVIRRATAAVREVSPDRPIIADGLEWGGQPLPELVDLNIGQSGRFYVPFHLTHYKAEWAGPEAMTWPEPVWPGLVEGRRAWNRDALDAYYRPWVELKKQGVFVSCGEGGAYNKTPHPVVLAWLRDVMSVLKEHDIGYLVWNFRGAFGILDSGRKDATYEDYHGHKLDRPMLELLREF